MNFKATNNAGFTLIEVLVALAITALIAVMAYSYFDQAIRALDSGQAQGEKLDALTTLLSVISRDMNEIAIRGVSDGNGGPEPPLLGGKSEKVPLTFTKRGWQNPAGMPRSDLQRVSYYVEEEKLMRLYWPVLDKTADAEPVRTELIGGVKELKLRFLDPNPLSTNGLGGEWVDNWSSAASVVLPNQPTPPPTKNPLPAAIEITLDLDGWGEIVRLYELPIRK